MASASFGSSDPQQGGKKMTENLSLASNHSQQNVDSNKQIRYPPILSTGIEI